MITACRKLPDKTQLLPALPQDPLVKVYFNHSPSAKYQEPYRLQTRLGDNLEQQIIDTISRATSTVDVALEMVSIICCSRLSPRRVCRR